MTIYNDIPTTLTSNLNYNMLNTSYNIYSTGNINVNNIYMSNANNTIGNNGMYYGAQGAIHNQVLYGGGGGGSSNWGYTGTFWTDMSGHNIKIGKDIKYFSKEETEEILKTYFLIEKLYEEFPQVKYMKDKLDVMIKLHTDIEDSDES